MHYENIFERYEKKYMLTADEYSDIVKIIRKHMEPDTHGKHTVCSIYFDTDDYRLIRTSIEKPLYKEKLRLRSYGVLKEGDCAFIELKKKFNRVVYKRRVPILCGGKDRYEFKDDMSCSEKQILREIDWFIQVYSPVPKVFIACDRIAYSGSHGLRITFDFDMRWRDTVLNLTSGTWGSPVAGSGILMEIKAGGAFPLWLAEALSEESIFPVSFSKYGTCYRNHLADPAGRKGGAASA